MRTEIVTTLKRQATSILADLPKDREIMITEHGKPAAYLVDVQTYESTKKRIEPKVRFHLLCHGHVPVVFLICQVSL